MTIHMMTEAQVRAFLADAEFDGLRTDSDFDDAMTATVFRPDDTIGWQAMEKNPGTWIAF